ncbi:MAG: hypothetical protein R3E94_01975 [Burkholderiaceae bacterium]
MQMPAMPTLSLLRQQASRTSSWARAMAVVGLAGAAWALSSGITPAQASDVYFSVGVNTPGVSVGVSNAPPVVYQPPVVHYPPAVVHYPPAVVHYPAPVVVQPPTVIYPRPVLAYPQPPAVIGRPVVVVPRPVYYDDGHRHSRHPGLHRGHHKGDRKHWDRGPRHYRD